MKIMDREKLKYYARMAAESYVDDPVHSYATKSVERRKKFVYHFMMERLATSNREDIIYFDEQERGLCVWRDAHNEYTMFDFLKCPNWVFLAYYWWHTAKTLKAYRGKKKTHYLFFFLLNILYIYIYIYIQFRISS